MIDIMGDIIIIIVVLTVVWVVRAAAAERSPEEIAKFIRNQQLTDYCLRYKEKYGVFPMSYEEYIEKTKAPLD